MQMNDFANGTLLDGRYKLLRPLSKDGATADVWLAIDTYVADEVYDEDIDKSYTREDTGVKVAIKIYRPKNALDLGEQKFKDEFKVAFECHHTNLLQPVNFSIYDGVPYLVMPYCPDGSSEKLIGKLNDADEQRNYILSIASGLAYLHDNNPRIIHQDIKPANILILNGNVYAITDFGISIKSNLNSYNEIDGTIAYMAPERFDDGYEPRAESDIWALGATAYEMITGRLPFGEDGGAAQKRGVTLGKLPPQCHVRIRRLIYACLSMDMDMRPTAKQVVDMLQKPIVPKRNYLPLVAICALVVAGGIWILSYLSNNEDSTSDKDAITMAQEDMLVDAPTYASAIAMMRTDPAIAYDKLMQLSGDGDSDATFLLSRLCFQSKSPSDVTVDSIVVLQNLLDVDIDNVKAHQLLLKAVEQSPLNYKAQYELGCDYMAGKARDLSYTRDINKARKAFEAARDAAVVLGDAEYVTLSDVRIRQIN